MITLDLSGSFTSPPIRSNDRLSWQAKARAVKSVRATVAWIAKAWLGSTPPAPIDYPVTVRMVWEVPDRRTRDAGASAPTMKAALDGMVDAGLLARDSHDVVTEERYAVDVCGRRGLRIEIETVDAVAQMPAKRPERAVDRAGVEIGSSAHPPTTNAI